MDKSIRGESVLDLSKASSCLLSLFAEYGYSAVSPPVLQPIEPFLDLSGEEIRRRIFVTQDNSGVELCLRPEFTIPVCRFHLEKSAGKLGRYSYLGPVFHLTAAQPDEVIQTGIESIGRGDGPALDAEVLLVAFDGLVRLGINEDDIQVAMGDVGVLGAFLDTLCISGVARRRVLRTIAARRSLSDDVHGRYAGLLATIEGQNPHEVHAFVEDVLAIAGISQVGGRSAADIADRFLIKAASQADIRGGLKAEKRSVIERYCAISGPPDEALNAIRALARDEGLVGDGLRDALGLLEERTGFMAAQGLPIDRFRFSAGFARNLDYYSGFIFEITSRARQSVLVGGGRYDNLLEWLGSPISQPAVGCTFWLANCVR